MNCRKCGSLSDNIFCQTCIYSSLQSTTNSKYKYNRKFQFLEQFEGKNIQVKDEVLEMVDEQIEKRKIERSKLTKAQLKSILCDLPSHNKI